MRFLLLNHIQNARDSLRSNRSRSMLTMFGVTIGVASITTILALSAGAAQIVQQQIDGLGGNVAVIRPGEKPASAFDQLTQLPVQQGYTASTLTNNDLRSIERIDGVSAIAPLMVLSGAVSGDSDAPKSTPIVATTPNLEQVNDLQVRDGQFLDPSLLGSTAVIGPQLSVDVFGTEASIGKTIAVKGKEFTIIGVLKRSNAPINFNGVDFDNAVIIDTKSLGSISQESPQIQQINVRVDTVANLNSVIVETNKALLRNHFGQADFTVLSGDEIAQPTGQIFAAIAGVTAAIAAISLLVGGIGIMNIMLVSVAERKREIGIRKAVGASNGDIVAQFLIEALALSIGGGVAGYLLGYFVAFGISIFLTFDPQFNFAIAGVALGVSIAIGTLFGLYPAIRAARKDPINALRQYE